MRILQISNLKNLKEIMQEIKVDNYGIKIMLPKAIHYLIRINSISCIAANILKQEILSLGGDAAVARDTLTGRAKNTDCLLMGTLSEFNHLIEKLNKQPFGLNLLADDLWNRLNNYQKDNFSIDLGRYKLNLKGNRACIMGIVNLTPDSFSGDGLYSSSLIQIVEFVEKMVEDGADIIDIGGESVRPGAKPVSLKEELRRTIPVIRKLAKVIKVPISIDTYKSEVARCALDNGAVMVNDITGLRSAQMAKVVSKYNAVIIIMHMKGKPATMQNNPVYDSLMDEIMGYLDSAVTRAVSFGIDRERIIIDPGIGFGKSLGHNLEILNRLREFKILGRPLLVGVSRKSFIGKILKVEPNVTVSRTIGTIASCVLAVKNGANIVRVHDVKEVKQALQISEAITYGTR